MRVIIIINECYVDEFECLSRHDVNVVYRPEHCGQSGDISDGDDSDDGVAMCVDSPRCPPVLMCRPASHYHSSSSWELTLITPDHPTRITNDRIMYVFGLINTKTTLNRKFIFMSLFIIFSLSN